MWHRLKLPPDQFSCLLAVERVQVRKAREPRVLGGAGGSVLIGRRERIRILVMPASEPVADIVYCHEPNVGQSESADVQLGPSDPQAL